MFSAVRLQPVLALVIIALWVAGTAGEAAWESGCGRTKESIRINTRLRDPVQLHIRQNVPGDVVLQNAGPRMDNVQIDIRYVGDDQFSSGLVSNYSVLDTIDGQVIFLQVDSKEAASKLPVALPGYLIGAVAGSAVTVFLIVLIIWCVRRSKQRGELHVDEGYKKNDERFNALYGNDSSYAGEREMSKESPILGNGLLPERLQKMQKDFLGGHDAGHESDGSDGLQGQYIPRLPGRQSSNECVQYRRRNMQECQENRDVDELCRLTNRIGPEECARHDACLCDSCHSLYDLDRVSLARGSDLPKPKVSSVVSSPTSDVSDGRGQKRDMSGYGYTKCQDFLSVVPSAPPPPPVRIESRKKAEEIHPLEPTKEQPLSRSTPRSSPKVARSPIAVKIEQRAPLPISAEIDTPVRKKPPSRSSREKKSKKHHNTESGQRSHRSQDGKNISDEHRQKSVKIETITHRRKDSNDDMGVGMNNSGIEQKQDDEANPRESKTTKVDVDTSRRELGLPRQNTASSDVSNSSKGSGVSKTYNILGLKDIRVNLELPRQSTTSSEGSALGSSHATGSECKSLDSSFTESQGSDWSEKFPFVRKKPKDAVQSSLSTAPSSETYERPISSVWKPISTFVTSLLPWAHNSSPDRKQVSELGKPSAQSKVNGSVTNTLPETSLEGKPENWIPNNIRKSARKPLIPVRGLSASEWEPLPPPKIVVCDEDHTLCDGVHSDHEEFQTSSKNDSISTDVSSAGKPAKSSHPRTAAVPRKALLGFTIITVLSLVYAQCPSSPRVQIVIQVPEDIFFGEVKIFFSRDHRGFVAVDGWRDKAASKIQIFDVPEVSHTDKEVCFPAYQCPHYGSEHLLGCDAGTQKCVCQRGYKLQNGACEDIDECLAGTYNSCPGNSACVNTVGSYRCRCKAGHYGNRDGCQGCAPRCPHEQFEVAPCTDATDRVCKPCSKCSGRSYEVGPCRTEADRRCLDVTNPFDIKDIAHVTYPAVSDKAGFTIESSGNVFTEDLHKTSALEYVWYVTDNNQRTDFYWKRESGMRIYVEVMNVSLIPEYEDVAHHSDNAYILNIANPDQDLKRRFRGVTTNYCRHPIPEYYDLSLEENHNRVTSVTAVVCDSTDPGVVRCPVGYKDGQTYYHRSVNKPCTKRGITLKPIEDATNSLLCTQETPILGDVFNRRLPKDELMSFPYWECPARRQRCDTCVRQSVCPPNSPFRNQTCCNLHCYRQGDCKSAWNEECINVPIECAKGSLLVYALHPVFANVTLKYQCHMVYVPTRQLYQVSYILRIPGRSSQKKTFVMDAFGEKGRHTNAKYKFGFLDVEHDIQYKLEDEYMLVAERDDGKPVLTDYEHSLYPFKRPSEFKGRPRVLTYTKTDFSASVQPTRPFGMNSANWKTGGCWKDTAGLFKKQKMYRRDDGYRVDLMKTSQWRQKSFRFSVVNQRKNPRIQVSVPANSSVLSEYYKRDSAYLLPNTLHYSLARNGTVWSIHLQGKVSKQDTFLALTVNDKLKKEELFRQEILVSSLSLFSVLLGVPRNQETVVDEQQFEVIIRDSRANHSIILTSISLENFRGESAIRAVRLPQLPSWNGYNALLTAGAVLIIALTLVYLIVVCTRRDPRQFDDPTLSKSFRPGVYAIRQNQNYDIQTLLVVGYVVFQFSYSLIFTFTIFMLIFSQYHHEDIATLATYPKYQEYQTNLTRAIIVDLRNHEAFELKRLFQNVQNRQNACENNTITLFNSTMKQMVDITNTHLVGMSENMMSIPHQSQRVLNRKLQNYDDHLASYMGEYKTTANSKLTYIFSIYEKLLKKVHKTDWLSLARRVKGSFGNTSVKYPVDPNTRLGMRDLEFMSFLGIDRPLDVQATPYNIKKRLQNLPATPRMPTPFINENVHLLGVVACSHLKLDRLVHNYEIRPEDASTSLLHVGRGDKLKTAPKESGNLFLNLGLGEMKNVLMYALISVDVLVVICRFSRMYTIVLQLRSNFVDRVRAGRTKNVFRDKCQTPCQQRDTGSTYVDYKEDNSITEETANSHVGMLGNNNSSRGISGTRSRRRRRSHQHETDCSSMLSVRGVLCVLNAVLGFVYKFVRQNFVPKILAGCMCALLAYRLAVFIDQSLQPINIRYLGNIDVLVHGLMVYINMTNAYLASQAEALNQTLPTYKAHMQNELQGLRKLHVLFNHDQNEIVTRYNEEMCALQRTLAGSKNCSNTLLPTLLKLEILPCTFVDIRPTIYTGFQPDDYILDAQSKAGPIILAARTVVLNLVASAFLVLIIMTSLQIFSQTVYMYLKTRRKIPIKTLYITDQVPPVKGTPREDSQRQPLLASSPPKYRNPPSESAV